MTNPEIIPAVMPTGYDDLVAKINQVAGVVETVQLDIMDGVFVPGRTWPFRTESNHEQSAADQAYWQAVQAGNAGLPMMESVEYELDLMVEHPDKNLEQWLALQPSRIVFHLESLFSPEQLLLDLAPVREIIEIGISFDDEQNIEEIAKTLLPQFDFIQVMGIDDIGSQGNPFSERTLYNLRALQHHLPEMMVSVDGAVNTQTIDKLAAAGADRFVVGSAVFSADDPRASIEQLRKLALPGSQI